MQDWKKVLMNPHLWLPWLVIGWATGLRLIYVNAYLKIFHNVMQVLYLVKNIWQTTLTRTDWKLAKFIFVQFDFLLSLCSLYQLKFKSKMSLQWNIVAGFLYSELAFTIFLLIPFISNRVWTAVIEITLIRFLQTQYFSLS